MSQKVIQIEKECPRCNEKMEINSSKQNWRCKCGAVIKILWDYKE